MKYLQCYKQPRSLVYCRHNETEGPTAKGLHVIIVVFKERDLSFKVFELELWNACCLQLLPHHLNQFDFISWFANHSPGFVRVGAARSSSTRKSWIIWTLVSWYSRDQRLLKDVLNAVLPDRRNISDSIPLTRDRGFRELLIQIRIHI
jgi:hypothetical protein